MCRAVRNTGDINGPKIGVEEVRAGVDDRSLARKHAHRPPAVGAGGDTGRGEGRGERGRVMERGRKGGRWGR